MRSARGFPGAPRPALCEVHFAKQGHHYIFRYQPGEEALLFCALLETARNPHFNMDLEDVRKFLASCAYSSQ